jgi:serine/threonine protein kinase
MFVSKPNARGDTSTCSTEWTLKIVDFGLSRNISASQSRLVSSVGAGTETWMPPEGMLHQHGTMKYPFSYDIHPCGSLLYFILSGGQHAFPGNHVYETQRNLKEGTHRNENDLSSAFLHSRNSRAVRTNQTKEQGETKSSSFARKRRVEGQILHPMESREAMDLIRRMLRRNPNERPKPLGGADPSLCMQVVLDHPFFMTSTDKLERIRKGKDTNWSSLQNKYLNDKQSDRWVNIPRLKNAKDFFAEERHYKNNLKELARFIRNTRVHVYDRQSGKSDSDLARFFGVDVVKREEDNETDDMLVKYFAKAVPDLFLQLIKWPIQW